MYEDCVISQYSTGCCQSCAELAAQAHKLPHRIEGPVHVCRTVVDGKYGLSSVPILFCDDHCPVCRERVRVRVA